MRTFAIGCLALAISGCSSLSQTSYSDDPTVSPRLSDSNVKLTTQERSVLEPSDQYDGDLLVELDDAAERTSQDHAKKETETSAYNSKEAEERARKSLLAADLSLALVTVKNELDAALAKLDARHELSVAKLAAQVQLKRTEAISKARAEQAKLTATAQRMGISLDPELMVSEYLDRREQSREEQVKGSEYLAQREGSKSGRSEPSEWSDVSIRNSDWDTADSYPRNIEEVRYEPEESRIKYDAVLVFGDEKTRELWFGYLKAYGIDDMFKSKNRRRGEHYIYLGSYDIPGNAKQRIAEVTDTIGNHVDSRIVSRNLTRVSSAY